VAEQPRLPRQLLGFILEALPRLLLIGPQAALEQSEVQLRLDFDESELVGFRELFAGGGSPLIEQGAALGAQLIEPALERTGNFTRPWRRQSLPRLPARQNGVAELSAANQRSVAEQRLEAEAELCRLVDLAVALRFLADRLEVGRHRFVAVRLPDHRLQGAVL